MYIIEEVIRPNHSNHRLRLVFKFPTLNPSTASTMPSTTILSGMNGSITFGDFIAQLSVQVSDKSLGYSDSLL